MALALCAAVVSGCGDDSTQVRYLNHPAVIRQSQVDRAKAGSPERAVIEWSRAVLFSDAITAARLYDPALGVTAGKLARQREKLQAVVSLFKSARISGVTGRTRTRATVLARVRVATSDASEDAFTTLAFAMKRVRGEWRLAGPLPAPVGGSGAG